MTDDETEADKIIIQDILVNQLKSNFDRLHALLSRQQAMSFAATVVLAGYSLQVVCFHDQADMSWKCHGLQGIDKQQLMLDVKDALYAAKITSYAQGMNIIRAKSEAQGWNVDLGGLARIWKVMPCSILDASDLLRMSYPQAELVMWWLMIKHAFVLDSAWHGRLLAGDGQAGLGAG